MSQSKNRTIGAGVTIGWTREQVIKKYADKPIEPRATSDFWTVPQLSDAEREKAKQGMACITSSLIIHDVQGFGVPGYVIVHFDSSEIAIRVRWMTTASLANLNKDYVMFIEKLLRQAFGRSVKKSIQGNTSQWFWPGKQDEVEYLVTTDRTGSKIEALSVAVRSVSEATPSFH